MTNLNCAQLQSACRLCLASDSKNVDIFSAEGQRQRYQDKIWKHFSVCVEDNLPKAICQLCCCRLEEYHSFVLDVEEVQQNIHKMVSALNHDANNIAVSHTEPRYEKVPSLNKSVNNSGPSKDIQSDVPDLIINSDVKTCKNPSDMFESFSSHVVLSDVHDKCFVAPDTKSEGIFFDVDSIKVEEGPLQTVNYICPDVNTAQEISKIAHCDSLSSGLVSVQMPSDKNCDFLADTSNISASDSLSRTVQCRKTKKTTAKTVVADNNLIKKCEHSVSEGEGDAEEVEVTTPTKFQNSVRNVALNSGSGDTGKEGESISMDENDCVGESEITVNAHSNEAALNTQLDEFYNYSCRICEPGISVFSSFFLLTKHYRLKHNTRGYVLCCGRKLLSKPLLASHMMKHLQPSIYKCRECGKELANEVTYEEHMIRHLPEHKRPFRCELCLRGFANKGKLQYHMRIHLPDEEKLASVCDTCGKKFANDRSLLSHQRYVHEKVREVMCHICPKTFPRQSALKQHLYTHVAKSEQKQCDDCGKWLKNDSTFQSHIKSHGSQLFSCPHCDKVYKFAQSLRAHLQSHSDARPHECLECGKTFKLKKVLMTHAVQHTGERPYKCPHCPRTFASSGNYYSHKKRMHANEKAGNVT
ncbi:zinc finger protein 154-like isoform X2 [Zootermopsis nevadensis]|uniref:zinc finger protein 154-like isoform X2 n=1 Tax=Zootermopsis nevadensis TaxID=136037 RepID=UPI000B8E6FD3|nr:zinc finger protein 154-like isoform X2 [Zootermopsis nevadensis]